LTPEQLAALGTVAAFLKDLGVLGAALIFIRMLLRGEIVTQKQHDDMKAEKDAQLAKSEARESEWKRVAQGLTETSRELTPEVREVLRAKREDRGER
jgi:hypothetical protein